MKSGSIPCNRCGKPVPPRSQLPGGIRCPNCRGKSDRWVQMFKARGTILSDTLPTATLGGDLADDEEVFWVAATATGENDTAERRKQAEDADWRDYRLRVASAWLAMKDHPAVWPRQREAWALVFGARHHGDVIYTKGLTNEEAGVQMGGISKPAINKLVRKAFDNAGVQRFRPQHRC